VNSAVKINFAELYRSAFAETDPGLKQQLLQQVQSMLDSWHFEEQKKHLQPSSEPVSSIQSVAS